MLLLLLQLLRIGQVLTPPSGLPFIGTKVRLDMIDGSRIEAVSVSRFRGRKCPRGSLIFLKDECVYNQPIIRIFKVPMLWYPGSRQGRDRVPCFPQNSLVESSGI